MLLADMPRVTAEHVDRLIDARNPQQPSIVVPRYAGRHGNPILWSRKFFPAMRAVSGDQGARGVLESHARRIHYVEMDDDAVHADVDTPDNLSALEGR